MRPGQTREPKPANDAGFGSFKRRGRDSNSRQTQRPVTVFETAAFDRSATPPAAAEFTGAAPRPARSPSGALVILSGAAPLVRFSRCTARPSSWPIAIIRRLAEFLPYGLSALTFLPFNFLLVRDGQQVGTYRRILGKLRDRYVLELGPGLEDADRRVVLAFAVALDALQDR